MTSPGSAPQPAGLFDRLSERLTATRRALAQGFNELIGAGQLDDAVLEDLEATLLQADVGIEATGRILETIKQSGGSASPRAALRQALLDLIRPCQQPLAIDTAHRPYVIMVVGVNGAGKTTTIGKLASRFKAEGRKVMLAAPGYSDYQSLGSA